jgi:hypothetical protein
MADYIPIPARRTRDPILEAIIENLELLTGQRGGDGAITQSNLLGAVSLALSASGNVTSYFQDDAPADTGQLSVGDLWFDSNDGNNQYRWNGTNWIDIKDSDINTALTNANDAEAKADGRVHTFWQTSTPLDSDIPNNASDPTDVIGHGDLWIDTNDSNHLYIYDASGIGVWESARDGAAGNPRVTTWFQDDPPDHIPDGVEEGDLWIDTNDKNQLYRSNGSIWQVARDTDIQQALTDAATAEALADGKIVTFYQDAPAPTATADGDLWVHLGENNKLYRWKESTTTWEDVHDTAIDTAQSTATSKIKTYYQIGDPNTPPGTLGADDEGDLWVDTDDGNRVWRWNGSAWEDARDTTIQDAQDDATQAISDAAAAQSDATQALSDLTDIADDDILSVVEKSEVKRQYDTIIAEQPGIDAEATSYGITTEKTAYDNSVTALTTYLGTLTSPVAWNNFTDETALGAGGGATFRTKFQDVYEDRQTLLNAIAAAAKVLADGAQTDADLAQATADGKINTYFQDDAPTLGVNDVGDLWVDTNSNPVNYTQRWNGTGWDPIQDGYIADVETIANSKITTYYQTGTPTDPSIGDIWVDTTGGDADWLRYDGATWQPMYNTEITQVQTDLLTKRAVYYGTNSGDVTGMDAGDLFIDSDDKRMYRYNGATWDDVQDTDIAVAQTTADGKNKVFYQSSPTPTAEKIGDIWVDTSTAGEWILYVAGAATNSDWGTVVDNGEVVLAKATADGKNVNYYGTDHTLVTGMDDGDTFHYTDTGAIWIYRDVGGWVEIENTKLRRQSDWLYDSGSSGTVNIEVGQRIGLDTSSAAVTLNLPRGVAGDRIGFYDDGGSFGDPYSVTVVADSNPSLQKIFALGESMTVDIKWASITMEYQDDTAGWVIY